MYRAEKMLALVKGLEGVLLDHGASRTEAASAVLYVYSCQAAATGLRRELLVASAAFGARAGYDLALTHVKKTRQGVALEPADFPALFTEAAYDEIAHNAASEVLEPKKDDAQ